MSSGRHITKSEKIQLALTIIWSLLIIPTIIWWRNSIAWVGFMSIYAIVVSHYAAYEAAKAAKMTEEAGSD